MLGWLALRNASLSLRCVRPCLSNRVYEFIPKDRKRQPNRKEGFTGKPDRFIEQDIGEASAGTLEQGFACDPRIDFCHQQIQEIDDHQGRDSPHIPTQRPFLLKVLGVAVAVEDGNKPATNKENIRHQIERTRPVIGVQGNIDVERNKEGQGSIGNPCWLGSLFATGYLGTALAVAVGIGELTGCYGPRSEI